jgi:uncharacterized protein (TIGR02145 family)/uncharacterized repeat protein (TIGR02543 family)
MKQTLNKKFALTLAVLSVLSILLFTVCDSGRTNPLDARGSNYVTPSIDIDTIGTNIGNGDTISTDSARIAMTGNRTESRFRARLDSVSWSLWESSGIFIFDTLKPGSHSLTIETKYNGGDVVVPKVITFFVRSPKSSSKALTSFSFAKFAAAGEITESARTVVVKVPYETDVSALVATFVATGATVKVGSKTQVSDTTPNNFSQPVIYRVTAVDSSYQDYTVKVEVGSNTAKAITAFSFTNSTSTIIDTATKTIVVNVPFSTDVSAIVPTLTHSGASVSPASGAAQNFTNAVTYTVTAADKSIQAYVVSVNVAPNTAKAITAFSFTNSTSTIIDTTAKTIVINVPFSTDVSALVPTLSHNGASVSPVSGAAQNFTNAVTYTVTAADKSIQAYVVSVNVSSNTSKAITAFSFTNSTSTIIDTLAKTIVVNVPFSTEVNALVPTLSHSGASVSPAIGTAQNFTNGVTYTVTAADKSIQSYVVTVTFAPYTFTVTFDGQNATVGPSPSTKTVTAPATTVVTLPTDPQRDGYRFDGWYTGTNGGGVPFVGSTNVTQTLTVFAKWTPVYTVTYNGNGTTVTVPVDANKYQNGQTVTVLSGITRADYTFAGWITQTDTTGAISYLSGSPFVMGSVNVVFYAKWRLNQPFITAQPESKTAPVNDSVTFMVSASGVNLGYQWQKNNIDITNATAASYTTPVAIADTLAATYKCVVSNAGGNVPSSGATLAVSTVNDASGNVYHQVKIGKQVWTMENLRTTKYNDNTDIPKDTSSATWANATTARYCYFGNTSNTDSIKKFGALYNWYTVSPTNVKKIAPTGWHVPAVAEWDTLQNWLIANGYNHDGTLNGNKIAKSMAANTDWATNSSAGAIGNNLATNNRSGFSALPGGSRAFDGSFGGVGGWLSTTESDVLFACRFLSAGFEYLRSYNFHKSSGFSVRLLKN